MRQPPEDYSQNDDGSNHHKPKGKSGPPKSVTKKLKDKTGWDWEAKAKDNASRATLEPGLESVLWTIKYADGSIYNIPSWDPVYKFGVKPNNEAIASFYYSASGGDLNSTPNYYFAMPDIITVPSPSYSPILVF